MFADSSGLDHRDPINPSLDCDSESHTSSDSNEDNSDNTYKLTVSLGNWRDDNHSIDGINCIIAILQKEVKFKFYNSTNLFQWK